MEADSAGYTESDTTGAPGPVCTASQTVTDAHGVGWSQTVTDAHGVGWSQTVTDAHGVGANSAGATRATANTN